MNKIMMIDKDEKRVKVTYKNGKTEIIGARYFQEVLMETSIIRKKIFTYQYLK